MMAVASAVRSALRRMFPITHACSHVKWAKVNDLSSRASSLRERPGEGNVSSMVLWEARIGDSTRLVRSQFSEHRTENLAASEVLYEVGVKLHARVLKHHHCWTAHKPQDQPQ